MLLSSKKEIELIRFKKKLKVSFKTSFEELNEREIFLVKIKDGSFEGWGEVSSGSTPYYSYECNNTAEIIIKEYLYPILKETFDPYVFHKKAVRIKGHHMAKASIEEALFDLKAKKEGIPLYKLYGAKKRKVPSGISIGIKPTIDELFKRIEYALEKGYKRIKLKIEPQKDYEILKQVRENYPDIPLMVDANSSYIPERDFELIKSFDEFSLIMIEQPYYEDDLYHHSVLRKALKTPLCLDESITSLRKANEGFLIGAFDIINVKTGRVGGPIEVIMINEFSKKYKIPLWMGGMLESGVGRLHNLHLAVLSEFSYPSDISESSRYWDKDIVEPEVEMVEKGYLEPSDTPGIGAEVRLPEKYFSQKIKI